MGPEGQTPEGFSSEEILEFEKPFGSSRETPPNLETMTPEEAANMMLSWGQPEIPRED